MKPFERNLLIYGRFLDPSPQTKKFNVFNRLAPLTKKPNDFKNLADELQVNPNEARSEPSDTLSGVLSGVVSGVLSGVMTVVVKGSIVTIVVSVPRSDFPLESIVVSQTARDRSSESECSVVVE